MSDIRTLLRLAARRLETTSFLGALHLALTIIAAVALSLALADRAGAAPFVPWAWVAPAFVAVALATAAFIWSRRRFTELQVALAVDDRLDLRERLSTALHVQGRDDPFAQAAVEDAVRTAQDRRVRETVGRRFAVRAPRRWWVGPLLVLVATAVLILPQADLFAAEDPEPEAETEQAQREVQDSLEVLVRTVEDKPELSKALGDFVDELAAKPAPHAALQRPEQIKREALKKVTELNERLDEILSGEQGKTAEALRGMMSRLEEPADGPAKDMAESLARGDFKEAKKALEAMMEQLEAGRMDEAQKAQLAAQLEQLAQQMAQLAQQQEALEQALQQAGLNPQLANNPQALQQAMQQAQHLNEQQKQQIQQMAQAQQMAQGMCQGLGGACQQMAQGLKQGQGQGQGAQQMQNQLGQMEQLQMLMQEAQAAMNACQGQGKGLGRGMNLNLALQQWQQGGGMGQRGQGAGGQAPLLPTPTGTRLVKADAPIGEGEVIASMLIDGSPVRGESKAKLKEVVSASAAGYDEAQAEDALPRRYHDAFKRYFGELARQVETVTTPTDAPADAGPAEEPTGSAPSDDAPGE